MVHVSKFAKGRGPTLKYFPVLQEYTDMFLKEVSRLPPNINIDFTINLVPYVAMMSKSTYTMRTLELVELKM